MNQMLARTIIILFCLTGTGPVFADQTEPQTAKDSADQPIDVTQTLSLPDFDARGQTTLQWWRDRTRYRDEVIAATRNDDPEISDRARWVQSQWQRGIVVDTPPDLARVLSATEPAEAIEVLLESGRFDAATIAMEETSGTIERASIAARVSVVVENRFPVYARLAVNNESVPNLIAFLNLAATNKKMALCLDDLVRRPGDQPTLPKSADTWQSDQRIETLCLLNLLRGNIDAATRIAAEHDASLSGDGDADETTGQRSLQRVVQMVTRQWDSIAASSVAEAQRNETIAAENEGQPAKVAREEAMRHWVDALIAASRAGDDTTRDMAIEALQRESKQGQELSATFQTLRWRALLIHGEVDSAIEWLGRTSPREAAAIGIRTSREVDALRRLGFPADQLDTQLESWLDAAIAQQRGLTEAELTRPSNVAPTEKVQDCLALMRAALEVGRDDVARRIADRLCSSRLFILNSPGRESILVQHYVLASLAPTIKTDWMFELAAPETHDALSPLTVRLVSGVVQPPSEELLFYLNWFVRSQQPAWPAPRCFVTACEIARSNDRDVKKHRDWIDRFGKHLQDGDPRSTNNSAEQYEVPAMPNAKDLQALFERHGRPDLTGALLRGRAQSGDLQAKLDQLEPARGKQTDPPSAEDYESIWLEVAGNPLTVLDDDLRQDTMIGFQAVLQQFLLANRRGDDALADQLRRQLAAMACTPSTDTRQRIADALADAGQWEMAERLYRSLLLLTAFESDETMALMDIARAYNQFVRLRTTIATNDSENAAEARLELLPDETIAMRREAIEWFDLGFSGTLAASDYREINYVIYPHLIAHDRLELLLQENRSERTDAEWAQIDRLFETMLRFEPIDVTSAESLLLRLQELGRADKAVQLLSRLVDAAERNLMDFPSNATLANNVAWCIVRNQTTPDPTQLDQALELARHAVAAEPDSAVFRDTLAEVLARRGELDQAIAIERAGLIDDPGQWHLHLQIDRFEAMR